MKQAGTIELFSYWDSLRAGLSRELLEADAANVRTLLASTYLIEVDERRAYPLRVIGSALARLTANARLGASFLECWEPQSRDLIETMLRVVHDERLPVVIGARASRGEQAPLVAECLLLPIAAEHGRKPRILGGVAPSGALNRRGSPAPLEAMSARAIRNPAAAPALVRERPAAEITPFSFIGDPVAHLRVIDGGRT
jgi:hypothetical protein